MIRNIPLTFLFSSAANARKTNQDAEVAALAADIAARGLLQPLVVTEIATGRYEVVAGERRRRALVRNAEVGIIRTDYPVPCNVRPAAGAAEDSLAENVQRVAMNPVDAFEAFAALVDSGMTPEEIARRFGATLRHVEQMLRLGRLSPLIRDQLRTGAITLDVAKAFAVSPDTGRQEAVLAALSRGYGGMTAENVRCQMTETHLSPSSPVARFVGDDYRAAGLPTLTDLFSASGTEATYLADTAKARELAQAKLDAEAARLTETEGWAWAVGTLDFDWSLTRGLRSVQPEGEGNLTPQDQAHLDELHERRARLIARFRTPRADDGDLDPFATQVNIDEISGDENGFDDGLDEVDDIAEVGSEDDDLYDLVSDEDRATLEALDEEIVDLEDKASQAVYTPEQKATAGVFVTLDRVGRICHYDGYVRPEDVSMSSHTKAARRNAEGAPVGQQSAAKRGPYSKALVDDLAAQRSAAFQSTLVDAPDHALTLVLVRLWIALHHIGHEPSITSISASMTCPKSSAADMTKGAAAQYMHARRAEFRKTLGIADIGHDQVALFDAIHALSTDGKLRLLAYLTATTVTVPLARHGERADAIAEHVGRLIGCDPAKWWRPTAEEFFTRVSKATLLESMPLPPRALATIAAARKVDSATLLGSMFADPEAVTAEMLGEAPDRATMKLIGQWLPAGMGFTTQPEPDAVAPSMDPAGGDGQLDEAA